MLYNFTMDWVTLTALAITSRAFYSIATKLLSGHVKVSPITHSLLLTTVAGILSLLLSPLIGGISFTGIGGYWISILLMVFSQAFGNIFFFKGLKDLDAGTTQIAFSSILMWVAGLSAVFLGSVFSTIQIIGMVLLLLSILLVQYQGKKLQIAPGILDIIISALLFAVFQVASADLSTNISSGAYLVLAYFGPSVIIGILYAKTLVKELSSLKTQLKSTTSNTLFASGTSLGYFIFSFFAYQQAPDRGIVVVLLTAQVILSVIFGIIFLKERGNMGKKLLAGILAVIAGILIKA